MLAPSQDLRQSKCLSFLLSELSIDKRSLGNLFDKLMHEFCQLTMLSWAKLSVTYFTLNEHFTARVEVI